MKKVLLFIAAVMFSASIFAQLQQWSVISTKVTVEKETTLKTEGANSAKITWTSTNNQDIESESFDVTSGADFKYTLDVMDNDPAGRIRMVIIWSSANDYQNIYSVDNADWQTLEYTGQVPATATTAKIRLRFYDVSAGWTGKETATVYVDNSIFSENDGANLVPDGSFESWPAADAVSTPEFSPVEGVYNSTQNITLSTTTTDATIYYTTDGATPDDNSTEYTTPFAVSTTTMVKAIAYKTGVPESMIAEATYIFPTIVNSISNLRAGTIDNNYTLTSEAFLTYQQSFRNAKCIQDATGGISIDDNDNKISTSYNLGDGITGITGTLTSYDGLLQFIPVVDPGAATSTSNDISAEEVTVSQLTSNWENYESKLIAIANVDFGAASGTEFADGTNYDVTIGGTPFIVRTQFYTIGGETIPTTAKVTGIAIDKNAMTIAPRNMADLSVITSTNDIIASSSIFPNPFDTQITVQANGIASVELINAIGQSVLKTKGNNMNEFTLPTSRLAKGIYIIKITETNGNVVTDKLMKK